MGYNFPDLPYSCKALEPYIDEETMKLHHGKHHAGYVEKLNRALDKHKDLMGLSIEELLGKIDELPEKLQQSVANNGGGHANHSLFWEVMGPDGGELGEELRGAIDSTFGGIDEFRRKFSEKAMGLFGSGWVFLELTKKGLNIKRHSFQNSPLMHGNVPILALDVWEHAYYLKYRNKKDEYVKAWWNVVNWERVGENFREV